MLLLEEDEDGVMVMAAQFMLNSCSRLYQVLRSGAVPSVFVLLAVRVWGTGGLRGSMVGGYVGGTETHQAKTTSPVGMSAGTVKSKVWPSALSPPLRCGQLPW